MFIPRLRVIQVKINSIVKLRVFFSWQTDTESKKLRQKSFLIECIQTALKNIQGTGELENVSFEFQEGMRNVAGSPDMPGVIDERCEKCHIFIGDMTITEHVSRFENTIRRIFHKKRKVTPNINVIYEYSRARCFISDNQIVNVCNTINGNPKSDNQLIPVDIRKYRFPITFTLTDSHNHKSERYQKVKSGLISELQDAIRPCAIAACKNLENDMRPFISHKAQMIDCGFNGGYIWTDGLNDLKDQIVKNKQVLRISGLSGLGKTRLVMESFREGKNKERYWYCDCQSTASSAIIERLRNVFADSNELILVLDNCNKQDAKDYAKLRASYRAANPLITIFNDPNEEEENFADYLSLQKEYDEVVEQILARFKTFYKEEDKEKLKEFAGGIPMMAELLVEGLRKGKALGQVTDEQLMSKLLGVERNCDERKMLQSLALFDYIGFKDDYHKQLEFIANEKSITVIDRNPVVLIAEFDSLILRYQDRKIIEKEGRYIGLRPAPIAIYLVCEWLKECTGERMLRVVKAIQDSSYASVLTESFSKRFRNLGFNEKARTILNYLLGENSPFSNAEVLNTDLGSRLFRSFVEVNPIVVAECLWRVFGKMSSEEIIKISEGRRNLVWTFEKLAFYGETFEIGAKLLLKFAVAENESYGNNATGVFLGLFHLYLPGTEASLEERLKILRWGWEFDEYKPLILKAIAHALKARDFVYMSGAEKQGTGKRQNYQPSKYKEIFDYWTGVLDLLKEHSLSSSRALEESCKIIVDSFSQILQFGGAGVIMPVIDDYCQAKKNDWDEMYNILNKFWVSKVWPSTPELYNQLVSLANRLKKTDFVSRFREVDNNNFLDFDKHLENIKAQYSELANEWIYKEQCNIDVLRSLYADKGSFTNHFGFAVAKISENNEILAKHFVEESLKIISENPEKSYSIFNGFIMGCTDEIFEYAHQLCQTQVKPQLFPMLACRNIAVTQIGELFDAVRNEEASPAMFSIYTNYHIWKEDEGDVADFFAKLLDLGGECINIALHNVHSLLFFQQDRNYKYLAKMIADRIVNGTIPFMYDQDAFSLTLQSLLEKFDSNELAKYVNEKYIEILNNHEAYVNHNYIVQEIYSCLLSKYFTDVWPYLSEKLIDENYFWFAYTIKDVVGCSTGCFTGSALFQENHEKELFEWCDRFPEKAPVALASYVPTMGQEGFSGYVIKLLDKYGDNKDMLSSLSSNLGTFSWTGSVVPLYEQQKAAFEGIRPHKNQNVDVWAQENIEYLNRTIQNEINREDETRLIYGE